ncbi:hypothetical protein SAMN05661096_00210 [Marivirga sericea]|uniref:Uncharacterized protein n=1 Tax=Marivirga sericea TaxID=1028 RepID=A0A1X7I4Q3_9BACT|nr:hypothetical protein SAMN05661096_00210 [Marivirga sericea]
MKKTLLIFFITLSALGQLLAFSGSKSTSSLGTRSKLIEYDSSTGHALSCAPRVRGVINGFRVQIS